MGRRQAQVMPRDCEFHVVVWGATGSTGRRAAPHMATRTAKGSDLRWALGGRSAAKLAAVRSGLGEGAADTPIVIADSDTPISHR